MGLLPVLHAPPGVNLGHQLLRNTCRPGKMEGSCLLPFQGYKETSGRGRLGKMGTISIRLGSQHLWYMVCLQYNNRAAGGSSQFVRD